MQFCFLTHMVSMEKNFYIKVEEEKVGPYTVEELKGLNIGRRDLVWDDFINDWTEAEKIFEINKMFRSIEAEKVTSEIGQQPIKPNSTPQYSSKDIIYNGQNNTTVGRIRYFNNGTLTLTTQNAEIQYRYANLAERFIARFLDVVIIAIPSVIFPFVASWLYFALMRSNQDQQTIGQQVMGIKTLSVDGQKIEFGQATGRYFADILNALTFFIGYLMFFFSPKNQCLHDSLAGTIIVSEIRRQSL